MDLKELSFRFVHVLIGLSVLAVLLGAWLGMVAYFAVQTYGLLK